MEDSNMMTVDKTCEHYKEIIPSFIQNIIRVYKSND